MCKYRNRKEEKNMNELEKLFKELKELNDQLLSSNAEKLEQIKRIQKKGSKTK